MLNHRYMLLVHIPYYVDSDGSVWMEQLWHHDFIAHLRYLRRLLLVAPREKKQDQLNLVEVSVPDGVELEFAPLPPQGGRFRALLYLPANILAIWLAVRRADIVHSGVVGWPYPLGWIANPFAIWFDKKLIIVVESAPWRLTGDIREGWPQRIREWVTERAARWCTRRADLGIFTQPAYRDSLMADGRGVAVIASATWISESDVLEDSKASEAWNEKPERIRILFASRLVQDKGVHILLSAALKLAAREIELDLVIIGEGPLREQCEAVAIELEGRSTNVKVLEPVAYGSPFMSLLRGFHAVVVPSLGDEQPRIVFDAYSQAVPVIAADTDGLRPNVEEGQTGRLFAPGDENALAAILERCVMERGDLRTMGLNALNTARRTTHKGMHDRRWQILLDLFGAG